MRFDIDASKLHQIAHHNRGTLLGYLARRFAGEDCSISIDGPELSAMARNHPNAVGCLLFQTTFAAGADSEAWEFNITSEWKRIASKDPRVLFTLHRGTAAAENIATQVHAFHSTRSDLSVYWRHTGDGPIVIFHSPMFTIRSDGADHEEKWEAVDLEVSARELSLYNDEVDQGNITPAKEQDARSDERHPARRIPQI